VSNPSWQPVPWQPQGSPSMLAAHADRERAVDVLKAGFAEGRLQQGEYERRVGRAYQARTVGELTLLVADLPQGPSVGHGVPQTFMPVAPPPPGTNGKAIGSMVCGVLCTMTFGVTGIPAVVLGHMARTEIRRTGEQGDGFAIAGLVLGWLSTAGWALIILLMIGASL
jgi:hypothetical protein